MELADGRPVTTATENQRGHFETPFTDEELERKFEGLAGRYLTDAGIDRVRGMLRSPETLGSVRELTDALRAGARPARA